MQWDRFVRTFHWTLVAGIAANYWILEAGELAHEWVGYGVGVLAGARVIWGFAGPLEARFKTFIATPKTVVKDTLALTNKQQLPSTHTPAGGYQLVAVIFMVFGIVLTGWMQELDAFWGVEWPQLTHEWLSNALMVLAVVHVAVILWLQIKLRLPLLQRMLWARR